MKAKYLLENEGETRNNRAAKLKGAHKGESSLNRVIAAQEKLAAIKRGQSFCAIRQ